MHYYVNSNQGPNSFWARRVIKLSRHWNFWFYYERAMGNKNDTMRLAFVNVLNRLFPRMRELKNCVNVKISFLNVFGYTKFPFFFTISRIPKNLKNLREFWGENFVRENFVIWQKSSSLFPDENYSRIISCIEYILKWVDNIQILRLAWTKSP